MTSSAACRTSAGNPAGPPAAASSGPRRSWSSFVVALALLVPFVLSGCTLIHDDDPFRVSVINHQGVPWTGHLIVRDAKGTVPFQRTLTVPDHTVSLTIDVIPLVGTFTFIVQANGQQWSDQQATQEGSYSWTVVLDESGHLCYEYLLGTASRQVCPTPTSTLD